jgi:hypothetical protein
MRDVIICVAAVLLAAAGTWLSVLVTRGRVP